jgi:hypothetical protein
MAMDDPLDGRQADARAPEVGSGVEPLNRREQVPSVPCGPRRMDKKWTNRLARRIRRSAKFLLELVELTGIEPVTS